MALSSSLVVVPIACGGGAAASKFAAPEQYSLLPTTPAGRCPSLALSCSPTARTDKLTRQSRLKDFSVRAVARESGSTLALDALAAVKHVLLPIVDRNPYLSEGTRQLSV